jgi:serine/threonine protein kinase
MTWMWVGSQRAAPEVVQGKGYGENVDVWALGVTFYALLTGQFPFGGGSRTADNPPEVFHRIVHQRLSLPDTVRRVSCVVCRVTCRVWLLTFLRG